MTIFGNNGQIVNTSKNVNWWSDGSTQTKTNNNIYDGNSIAAMTNNTGQIWTGVNSEDDAMLIIAHKLK